MSLSLKQFQLFLRQLNLVDAALFGLPEWNAVVSLPSPSPRSIIPYMAVELRELNHLSHQSTSTNEPVQEGGLVHFYSYSILLLDPELFFCVTGPSFASRYGQGSMNNHKTDGSGRRSVTGCIFPWIKTLTSQRKRVDCNGLCASTFRTDN